MPKTQDLNRNLLGRLGEDVATRFLEKKGYQIIERNFRCRLGEIDIIAEIDEYLVFVEVKSRYQSSLMINPLISMTKSKCYRIRLLAKTYLQQHQVRSKQPRFDVISIIFENQKRYDLEHIENAF